MQGKTTSAPPSPRPIQTLPHPPGSMRRDEMLAAINAGRSLGARKHRNALRFVQAHSKVEWPLRVDAADVAGALDQLVADGIIDRVRRVHIGDEIGQVVRRAAEASYDELHAHGL